ncbi:ion channel [Kordiimonas marina]|uniref:ion channel n=1 Tax=Kordiimonas marina TaxID=2872312 RepID=UPI001FF328EB|nr:ion channel [Kordiimonas marina]MCJ9427826.1 ion transporter [Kordiimonas marina]
MRERLQRLYYGDDKSGRWFRYFLLIFDLVTISYFIISSLLHEGQTGRILDYLIALVLAADYGARMVLEKKRLRYAFRFSSLTDLIVILSLLSPLLVENLAFLRVVRMLRLMRSYHMLKTLRGEVPWFKRNEQIIQSSINLVIFIFVITAVVYVLEARQNPAINNYFDALYFTVATLTTTGYGDITMSDSLGRMVTIVIMVFGVGLFLRLVQTIFRPIKVEYKCPSCGLSRHDPDAVHCKHCGVVLNIPTEGDWG